MDRGWLLYQREDIDRNRRFADWFVEAGPEFGFDIALRLVDELTLHLPAGSAAKGAGEPLPAFALNRGRDGLVSAFLQDAGCRVFNSTAVTAVANDKMRSHMLARQLGLPQVDMAFVPNAPVALAAQPLGWPVVVKHPGGHGGGQVLLARTAEELCTAAASFGGERVLLQRLCAQPGVDLRVYVLGGQVLQAVRRTAGEGFRANLSLGGHAEAVATPPAVARMVGAICGVLPLDYAGVDFLPDGQGGWLFNEIEDAVGSRALYEIGGFDVVRLFLAHVRATLDAQVAPNRI